MDAKALERYLHAHIPLSAAMAVTVQAASEHGVTLEAPLAPNINHRDTLFGGSASALAILAAWALIYVRLEAVGVAGRIVIRANTMRYDKPVAGPALVTAHPPGDAAWSRSLSALARRRMARLCVHATVDDGGNRACRFEGEFVILPSLA